MRRHWRCWQHCPTDRSRSRRLIGFGHRVVHGGPDMDAPVLVDDATLARIEALEPLAPLHNPPAVAVLKALAALFPEPAACRLLRYRVPSRPSARWPIASRSRTRCIARVCGATASTDCPTNTSPARWRNVCPEIALGRVVVAHLGSGASMCALAGGRSVDSSMGFTALDGLPMGTRPGSLDRRHDPVAAAAERLGRRSGRAFPLRRLRPEGTVRRVERHAHAAGERRAAGAGLPWNISSTMSRAPRRRWRRSMGGIDAHGVYRRHRRTQSRNPRARAASAALARLFDRRGGEPGRGPRC